MFVFQDHCHVRGLLHWWETLLIPFRPHWLLQLRVLPTERWKAAITSCSTRGNAAISVSSDCATGNVSIVHHRWKTLKKKLCAFISASVYDKAPSYTTTCHMQKRIYFCSHFSPSDISSESHLPVMHEGLLFQLIYADFRFLCVCFTACGRQEKSESHPSIHQSARYRRDQVYLMSTHGEPYRNINQMGLMHKSLNLPCHVKQTIMCLN